MFDKSPKGVGEDYAEKRAEEFYNFLELHNFLKKEPKLNPDIEWLIKDKANLQFYFNCRMLEFLKQPNDTFLTLCRRYDRGTFEKEKKVIPFVLLAEIALSSYESLKRVLLLGLDFERMDLKKKNPTYGNIIAKLECCGLDEKIIEKMDNKLRNIVAHSSWFVKDGIFTNTDYKIKMSYEKFERRVDDFTYFANKFYGLYWKDHTTRKMLNVASKKMIQDWFEDAH